MTVKGVSKEVVAHYKAPNPLVGFILNNEISADYACNLSYKVIQEEAVSWTLFVHMALILMMGEAIAHIEGELPAPIVPNISEVVPKNLALQSDNPGDIDEDSQEEDATRSQTLRLWR